MVSSMKGAQSACLRDDWLLRAVPVVSVVIDLAMQSRSALSVSERDGHRAMSSARLSKAIMVSRVLPPALPPGHGIELFPVLHAGSSSPCGVALKPLERQVSGAFCVRLLLILLLSVKQQSETHITNQTRQGS